MNIVSPKLRFLADRAKANAHAETVRSPEFKSAVEAAMLNYLIGLDGLDPRSSIKFEGAKGVVHELLNLGDPTKPFTQNVNQELQPT